MADSKPQYLNAAPELINRFIHPFTMAVIGQTMVVKLNYSIPVIYQVRS